MKNKAKRIVSAVCALAMCAAMLPAAAMAEERVGEISTNETASVQVVDNNVKSENSTNAMTDVMAMSDVSGDVVDDNLLEPGSHKIAIGAEVVLRGTENDSDSNEWTVYADGGYDDNGIQIVSGGDTNVATIKALKSGVYSVRHRWSLSSFPYTDSDSFRITVTDSSVTLSDVQLYVEASGLPYSEGQVVPTTLNFRLRYRGTAAPTSSGNFDGQFKPVTLTATVTQSGARVQIVPVDATNTDLALLVGYYELRLVKEGVDSVWDADETYKDEVLYFQVTDEGLIKFVTSGNKPVTDDEGLAKITMVNAADVYTLTFAVGAGDAIPAALCQSGDAVVLPAATCTGFIFSGWKDGDGVVYQAGDSYTISADVTLTALWTESTPEPEPDPDPGEDEEVQWEVSKSKTATNLDENYESQVTLSLPAADEQLVSDVVFVLDKSTSTDVEDEMIAMLEDLSAQVEETDAKVNVGVVIFNKVANSVLELTELNETNMPKIEAAVTTEISSGTNTHAGLLAGMEMLDEDTSVDANRKYMIFVSDGLTYIFDAEANAINSQQSATGEDAVMAGNDCWSIRHYDEGGNNFIPKDWNAYLSDVGDHLDEVQQYIQPYASMSQENHIPRGNTELPTTVDVAMYKTSQTLEMMMDKGYNCYVMQAEAPAASDYPWGPAFMEYLQKETGNGEVTFEEIQNDIYYLLDAGSKVVDVIGYGEDYDFEFVNEASALTMTVGKETLATTKIGENEYGFGTANDGVYPYVLTYQPADTSTGTEEQFTWTMNVPVSQFAPVQLTYTVKLTNPKTEVGTYGQYDEDGSEGYDGLLTNKSATLNPVDSNDQPGKPEEFAKPTVSYTVNPSLTPIIPLPGSSELGDLLNVKVVCVTNTAHEEYHSGVPAGSYSIQLVDSDTAIVTLPNDRFVELYNMMNPSTTHTLADSSAKGYTVELSLVDSKWVRTDPSVEIVFEVACETPSETVTVPGTSSTPTPSTPSATPTPTPTAQTTAIPQTSDDLPLGLLIVVAIAAAGAVCGLVVLRKRSKQ